MAENLIIIIIRAGYLTIFQKYRLQIALLNKSTFHLKKVL